jgi:hypothetical protein
MAYLRYYQLRGDPGFFGGLLKGIGGAIGGAFHAVTGLGGKAAAAPGGASASDIAAAVKGALGSGVGAVGGAIRKHPKLALGAGAAAAGLGAGAILTPRQARAMIPGARRGPRMNVCNVRALRRSMRRVTGFAREANKVMSFTKRHHIKKRKRR